METKEKSVDPNPIMIYKECVIPVSKSKIRWYTLRIKIEGRSQDD